MIKFKKIQFSLFTCLLMLAVSAVQAKTISIPLLPDAKVFAKFEDSMPAVVNYFTHSNEQQVIDFYTEKFGKSISQQRKRKRLTLVFKQNNDHLRVVISKQNRMTQVDIIKIAITKKASN